MSDSVLLAAKSGSVDAVNELVVLIQDYVFTVAKNFLGNNHSPSIDVEDVMQDALLAIIRDLPQCQAETYESFVGWASYVVRNRVYNTITREKCQKRGSGKKVLSLSYLNNTSDKREVMEQTYLSAYDASDFNRDTSRALSQRDSGLQSEETREQLDILHDLARGHKSERVRSVALLFMDGFSYEEIAETLGCTKYSAYAAMKRFRADALELVG